MHKRVVEARPLLYKVAYQKAKLQLEFVKRDWYLHESVTLDAKIKALSKYFSTYCKLKGTTNSIDILGSVIDHLRRESCAGLFIRICRC
uniref:Uncharacterized protein n=1 Tax=Cucumis sativus TaxID=3659 RepID=A0A0A0LVH7_CUCSA